MSDRKPILSREEVTNGTFTDVPWNSERAIGALNLQVFYEANMSLRKAPASKEEQRAPDGWYKEHCKRSALEYVDNLREEFKGDPTIAGIAEQAFIAGRMNPAIELAALQAKITGGELILRSEVEAMISKPPCTMPCSVPGCPDPKGYACRQAHDNG